MKTRILLLALTSSGLAPAFTIVQTKTFSYIPSDSAALVFDQFDNLGGSLTLTGITFTTTVNKTGGSLYVDNDSITPAFGNIFQSVTINLSSADVDLLAILSGVIGSNVSVSSSYAATTEADDGDGAGVQPGGADYDGTSFAPTSTSVSQDVKPIVWSEYEGTGTYTINAIGIQGYKAEAFGGAEIGISPANASGDVTVTYSFVPEPTTAMLGGLGFLALLRRRRY